MAKKQTSEALSTLGARYMRMSNTRMRVRFRKNRLTFFADIRRFDWSDQTKRGQDFTRIAGNQALEGVKQRGSGAAWFDKALDERRAAATAIKNGNDWFGAGDDCSLQRRHGSKSSGRKFASAMIAKIPLPLSRYIAATFKPKIQGRAA